MLVAHKYSIIKRIGGGEFGQVYAGKNERTGEIVAIKLEPSSHQINILKRESTILNFLYSKLCRNVPPVYWFGNYGDTQVAMVLPYYADELTSDGALDKMTFLRSAVQILRQIHQHGVVHRDIKPANWMLRTGKTVAKELILIDFGLAAFVDPGPESGPESCPGPESADVDRDRRGYNIVGTPKFASRFVHCGHEYQKRDDLISALYLAMWLHHGDTMWDSIVELEGEEDKQEIGYIEISLDSGSESESESKTHVAHPMNAWLKRAKQKDNVVRLCREMGDARLVRMADTLYANNIEYSYRMFDG